jgi:8-oxo-dGTP pyrophosphatase MutT (NUDIX family)
MDTRGGAAPDWTKRYRLVAGVYAMRDGDLLMLERARGMMIGFWSVPGGHVELGETPQDAAARELCEEAGLTPTGLLWLVTAVPLKGYGMDVLSLRYACPCDAGEVRLSHEHAAWQWVEPAAYRTTHVSDAAVARWRQASPDEAFNVLSNRQGLDDYLRWRSHGPREV